MPGLAPRSKCGRLEPRHSRESFMKVGLSIADAGDACIRGSCRAGAAGEHDVSSSPAPGRQRRRSRRAGRRRRHCQTLAQAAGAGSKTWHAYLSTQGDGAVNARDRIGKGPWQNAKGVVVATSVDDLHSANNKLSKQNNLSRERRDHQRRRRHAEQARHPHRVDSRTAKRFPADKDMTCKNYTSSTQGSVMLGHNDRSGLRDDDASNSWNSSHPSRGPDGGCSQNDLRSHRRRRLLYCFAVN